MVGPPLSPKVGVVATVGFAGRAVAGPVGEARLVSSLDEAAEIYGGREAGREGDRVPYLVLAAGAFFLNGGRRLYLARAGAGGDGGLATALDALAHVDEIDLVAAPGDGGPDAASALVAHAEKARDRFALVDPPAGCSVEEVRRFRGRFDSGHAALYHPWVLASADLGGAVLPPSGFVAGIYARGDDAGGVLKPPTADAVRGVEGLESVLDREAQATLNQEGVNVLRVFEGEGIRLWGARTMSSDPEWRYVNIRRYLLFLERSLDQGTKWAVFEPNGEPLWAGVRQTVAEFLLAEWRAGHLMGRKPEDAYFVRCDRTTMTQDDVDHGRLVVLVGVAPVRPAEFVILRIGQRTAGAPHAG